MPLTMPPIKGAQLVLLTIAVSLGIFMNVLDTSIANVAIPTIAGNLGVSPDQGTWVITSFAVSTAIVLPISGWLAKQFGEVRLFVISTLLFTVASLCCGLSSNLSMLVFFRVVQGAVAGPMIPLSQSLLLENFPADKKNLATGLWGMVAVAAPVFGPILGGYLTDDFSWPWIFYINIPAGLFSIYFTWTILRNRETKITKLPVDFIGLILLALGVGCLQVVLDQGHNLDWFNSSFIIIFSIISFISLSFFIAWELTEKYPIVDLSLFKIRNFAVGTTIISLGYMIYFGSVVVLPLWLQTQQNYTPTWAGLVTAPLGILPILLSPVVGRFMGKIDLRMWVSFSFLVFAYCSFWIAGFNPNVDAGTIAFSRFVQGIGLPCFFIPTIAIIFSGLPSDRIASASGLSNFLRILAGSFGTSISVTLWDHRAAIHQSKLVESLPSYKTQLLNVIQHLHALGFSNKASYAIVTKTVIKQAYMLGTADIFWISGCAFLGLIIIAWCARPPFSTADSSGTAAH